MKKIPSLTLILSWLKTAILLLFSPSLIPLSLQAGTLYVDGTRGSDQNPGTMELPLLTLQRAVNLAQPGDTVALVPGQEDLHQNLVITNKSGLPSQPIIIEGNHNTLTGSRVIPANEWELIRPGVYRHPNLLAAFRTSAGTLPDMLVRRFFLVIDDRPHRMGRSSKGHRPALPQPEELLPGQWTLSTENGHLYLALEDSLSIHNVRIEVPLLSSGISTRGTCKHWVIRNLHVKRFFNDGFNFHGHTEDLHIKDCSARECGDDGMSAHGTCVIVVDGFYSTKNSTGICHIEQASSVNRRVVVENNHGVNLYLLGSGVHTFFESDISALGSGIRLGHGDNDTMAIVFQDCRFDWEQNTDRPGVESWKFGTALRLLYPAQSALENNTPSALP